MLDQPHLQLSVPSEFPRSWVKCQDKNSNSNMYGNNPYALAGWPNPQNPLSVTANPWFPNAPQGPTFGALPSPTNSSSGRYSFEFTPVNPNILNCTVVGPGNNIYFRIVTTNDGVTTIFKPRDQAMARIEWGGELAVEIKDVVPRQRVSQWLPLSADQRSDILYAASSTMH